MLFSSFFFSFPPTAEAQLKSAEATPGYTHLVLQLLSSPQFSSVHQPASIHFKNLIRSGYSEETGFIPSSDKPVLKQNLVSILTGCTNDAMKKQLGEAISIISETDYPKDWNDLMPSLVSHFNSSDSSTLNNVLYVLTSLLKRYTFVTRTDPLLLSLQYTLVNLQTPYLSLLTATAARLLQSPPSDKKELSALVDSLRLLCQIYFQLNWLELPEYFEDEIAKSMAIFSSLLEYSSPLLAVSADDDEEGPVEKMKSQIIDCLEVYVSKDEEPFQPFLTQFTTLVWNLLTTLPTTTAHDNLTTAALSFLSSIVSKPAHANIFGTADIITQIISLIILKNVQLRDVDVEKYEDDPADYIVSDFEGSDTGSRRNCATDLLKSLSKSFPSQTAPVVMTHVTSMLAKYDADKTQWKLKDAALSMITAIAVVRESQAGGVSEVRDREQIESGGENRFRRGGGGGNRKETGRTNGSGRRGGDFQRLRIQP